MWTNIVIIVFGLAGYTNLYIYIYNTWRFRGGAFLWHMMHVCSTKWVHKLEQQMEKWR